MSPARKMYTKREQRFSRLTAREREVVDLLAEGLRNHGIAGCLSIADKTVKHHISSILASCSSTSGRKPRCRRRGWGLGRRSPKR